MQIFMLSYTFFVHIAFIQLFLQDVFYAQLPSIILTEFYR